jgi:hypothetical protein
MALRQRPSLDMTPEESSFCTAKAFMMVFLKDYGKKDLPRAREAARNLIAELQRFLSLTKGEE